MNRRLPDFLRAFLGRLSQAGFVGYLVGGAVRDLLLARTLRDCDLATNATPQQVRTLFSDCEISGEGERWGSLTVRWQERDLEVTTFRREGDYRDRRHPESVVFVPDLETDLLRRDFTVCAMALGEEGTLIDPFGGREDLAAGILRTVGDPVRRFREDPLRILRGLRFCACYGLVPEEGTRRAMLSERTLLRTLSGACIFREFVGLLCGAHAQRVLLSMREIIAEIVPEVAECFDFDQQSVYHSYDVYTHIAKVVGACAPEPLLRLSAFYHDIGKPRAYYFGEDGHGHFTGHGAYSKEIAKNSLASLAQGSLSREQITEILALVEHHDEILFPSEKSVRRALFRHGRERLERLVALEEADALSHAAWAAEQKLRQLGEFRALLEEQLRAGNAFSLARLNVKGEDLLALGIPPSRQLGALLDELMDAVVEGRVENERGALLALAEKIRKTND